MKLIAKCSKGITFKSWLTLKSIYAAYGENFSILVRNNHNKWKYLFSVFMWNKSKWSYLSLQSYTFQNNQSQLFIFQACWGRYFNKTHSAFKYTTHEKNVLNKLNLVYQKGAQWQSEPGLSNVHEISGAQRYSAFIPLGKLPAPRSLHQSTGLINSLQTQSH